jgi:VanZ family protein
VAVNLPANPLSILLHSWPAYFDRFILRDILVNVALYIPAGLTGHLAFRKFGSMWLSLAAPVLICTAFSASIEMTQLFVPPRDCSLLDLITNIFGSVIGVFLAIVLEEVFMYHRPRTSSGKPRKQPDRAALALLGCWAAWLLLPLFPVMGRTALWHKFRIFVQSPVTDWVPLISAALVWFVAGNLFRAAALRPARWLTAISVLLIPAQFFILDRQPVPSEMAGAVVGTACFAILWPARNVYKDAMWKIQAWAFLGLIVVRGLAPFQFVPGANTFSWIPFGGFFEMVWQTGAQVIAEKFFWYGTAIWLMLAAGLRAWTAIALVAATLLVIEIAQTRLPGRTAEITDPLLAIFAGFALTKIAAGAVTRREAGFG